MRPAWPTLPVATAATVPPADMRVCDGIWKTRQGRRRSTIPTTRSSTRTRPVGDDELDGPFDIEDFDDPATATVGRLDLGSVLIPMPEAGQVQVELTEGGVPSAVWVVTPNGRFTVAAYAAPKSAALWREVATELADSLRKDASEVRIEDGPWGREVVGVGAGRCGPVHRRRRLPVDDPLRRERPAGDHRRAERRGAGSLGGHRCSSRRHAAAGAHPASGAVARADGRAAAGRRRAAGAPQQAASSSSSSSHRRRSPSRAAASTGSAMQQLRTITGG